MTQSLKTRQLKFSSDDEYELYKIALEWSLSEPIVIEGPDDIRSVSNWVGNLEPYQHQISNLITFCRRLPVTLLADDVGLGKTVSAGLVASELMARGRVSKILIVCPKLIMPQWKEELRTKFNIPSILATGSDLMSASLPPGGGALITTYHSARVYLPKIVNKGFELLILDEAHKLRNLYGTDKSPVVAQTFKKSLANRDFKYVLMLTATPIQNRLWDMYSLFDLLAVARGHENPFGTEGFFARQYIADGRERARQLKPDRREEFRSIVYTHMSRIRRADAKLSFPDRVIQRHYVKPSGDEKNLFKLMMSESIQRLDKWSQMSVAKALVSSPHALAAELESRSKKNPDLQPLALEVRALANSIRETSKQKGLEILIDQLQKENPSDWRIVLFTTRLETQTTLEIFLAGKGIKCGTINGASGSRNSDTLERFRKNPPDLHVILSTEAGAEGVNLQVANVVVNYDLPWNPMVVEQRIGRVQRLASKHGKVCVFNMTLQGTFEDFIVGRLIEKLQLAAHAIGDIDSLLGAAGIIDEDNGDGFEEKIGELVIAALAGKNVEEDIRLQEESIERAKAQLKAEGQHIDELLGNGAQYEYRGPKSPKLEKPDHSLDLETFIGRAVSLLGGKLIPQEKGQYLLELEGVSKIISLNMSSREQGAKIKPFGPGDPDFERIVSRIANDGRQVVVDADNDLEHQLRTKAENWTTSFGGKYVNHRISRVFPCFQGSALIRTRVTVAHDSYERIVEVHRAPVRSEKLSQEQIEPLPRFVRNSEILGIIPDDLVASSLKEANVAEFCRFYGERLKHELNFAGTNERLRKKIEDDFTPRFQTELVGFKGDYFRRVIATVFYSLGSNDVYQTDLDLTPHTDEFAIQSTMEMCALTKNFVPTDALGICALTNRRVIKHLLMKSDLSGRTSTPDNFVTCAVSSKQLLFDEVQKSAVTGRLIAPNLLKKSEVSGLFAEPEYVENCAFTHTPVLASELLISEISQKKYRADQKLESKASGRVGHISEFIQCAETNQPLAVSEAAICELTGKQVLPSELVTCAVTGKKVVKSSCVISDITGKHIISDKSVRCEISGKIAEPEFFERCSFTGVQALSQELLVSQISEKKFRADQQARSIISQKIGHTSEFIRCAETNHPLALVEAERCEITGKNVIPGVLEVCSVTGMKALPSELIRCAASGRKAIKKVCVTSSISGSLMIEKESIISLSGKYCIPFEAKTCIWTFKKLHPEDASKCRLTGLIFRKDLLKDREYFSNLADLLKGVRIRLDRPDIHSEILALGRRVFNNASLEIEGAELSPSGIHLAVCLKVSTLFGLKIRHAGFLYSIDDRSVTGRVLLGKRKDGIWTQESEKLKPAA